MVPRINVYIRYTSSGRNDKQNKNVMANREREFQSITSLRYKHSSNQDYVTRFYRFISNDHVVKIARLVCTCRNQFRFVLLTCPIPAIKYFGKAYHDNRLDAQTITAVLENSARENVTRK